MALFSEPHHQHGNMFEEDLRQGQDSGYMRSPGSGYSNNHAGFFHDDDEIQPDLRPLSLSSGTWTLLPAISRCDNAVLPKGPFSARAFRRAKAFRDEESELEDGLREDAEEVLVPFFVKEKDKQPIGFLRPKVLDALVLDNHNAVTKMKMQPCWKLLRSGSTSSTTKEDGDIWGVAFADWINSPEGEESASEIRSEHMDRLARGWKQENRFPEELNGWRNEQYAIYGPPLSQDDPDFTPLPGANTVFSLERSACSLFGFPTFGVHLTAYVKNADNQYLIWTPRRSKTKQTWPGHLDNSVAGGITAGDSPLESVVRECVEEASLPPSYVRKKIRSAGVISYIYKNAKGWLQPEIQYTYDLHMPAPPERVESAASASSAKSNAESAKSREDGDGREIQEDGFPLLNADREPVVLRPNDGEAEAFTLMPVQEVLEKIVNEEFKPNCALVLIDFFIRHGLLTAETDAKFLEICQRLHRDLSPLPGPA